MKTSPIRSRSRKTTPLSVLVALMMAVGILLASTASVPEAKADEPAACDWHRFTDDGDAGGSSGHVWLEAPGDDMAYSVQFWAKDELLHLWDFTTDGHKAEATVYVTTPGGTKVDLDTFKTGTNKLYHLGSPDGSGDIPEGYKVWIRLRHTGGDWCNARMFTA